MSVIVSDSNGNKIEADNWSVSQLGDNEDVGTLHIYRDDQPVLLIGFRKGDVDIEIDLNNITNIHIKGVTLP